MDQKVRKRRFLTIKRIYDALDAVGVSERDADERIAKRTRSGTGSVRNWKRGVAMPGDENHQMLVQMMQDLEDEAVQRGGSGARKPAVRRKVVRKKKSPSGRQQSDSLREAEAEPSESNTEDQEDSSARVLQSASILSAEGRSSLEVERIESAIGDLGSDDVMRVAAAVLNRILALQAESRKA